MENTAPIETARYVVRQFTVVNGWDYEVTSSYVFDTITNELGVSPLGSAGTRLICKTINQDDPYAFGPAEDLGSRVARIAAGIVQRSTL